MRDKLIELIDAGRGCPDDIAPFLDEACLGCRYRDEKDCDLVRLADYLIDHGVTLAEDNNVPTNGDCIRATTDEELAWNLIFWRDDWNDWETPVGCYSEWDAVHTKIY